MFHSLFQRLADGGTPRSGFESGVQRLLGVLSPFYGTGAYVNRLLHEGGLKDRRRLPVPVLSVGNITLGGTGKTPFCLWLIDRLREEGRRPAIVTRGYGREDEDELVVVHDGRQLRATTREAGDEPVLLAKALGDVPVVACANRYRAGRFAIRKFRADTIVLDDGFQHHRLERQGDLVLVDATQRPSALRVFPRGTLREPAGVLKRAHLIVLTRCNQSKNVKAVLRDVKRHAPHVPVVRGRLVEKGVEDFATGRRIDDGDLKGKKALIICAVGNPRSVAESARAMGLRVSGLKALADHAALSPELIRRMETIRKRRGADYLLVTEKDAVKLDELGPMPESLAVLRVRFDVPGKKQKELAKKTIRARLHARGVQGYLR